MNKYLKVIGVILIIFFLSLFFSRYTTSYQSKSVLTDEAIERFEKDIKEGKQINAKNYLEEEKDYSNKVSDLGLKTSKLIEKTFNKGMSFLIKCLEESQSP